MKNRLLFIISIFLVFITSCNKNSLVENDNTEEKSILISKTWRYMKVVRIPSYVVYFSHTTCMTDSTNFYNDGSYIHSMCNSDKFEGNWRWISIDEKFEVEKFYNGEIHLSTWTILEMNDSILYVKIVEEDQVDYYEFKYSGVQLSLNDWLEFVTPTSP